MSKELDFNKSVADLIKEYPEVKNVMIQLGFKDLANPIALQTVGKHVTIPQGAGMKNIPMERIILSFEAHGFTIKGQEEKKEEAPAAKPKMHRVRLNGGPAMSEGASRLSVYLTRLNNGEDLDSVREDFAREFDTVPVHDIMQAEQNLIANGADPRKMKDLCDLHSALFHGREEAEIHAEESRVKDKIDLKSIPMGHPVRYFLMEDTALSGLMEQVQAADASDDAETLAKLLGTLKKIRQYYGKKEELLMPVLEYRYKVTGPSQVMWAVDDEMKKEVSMLSMMLKDTGISSVHESLAALLERMKEMIYKDENILLPTCLEHFTKEEWYGVYQGLYEMGPIFMKEAIPVWKEAEDALNRQKEEADKGLEEGTVRFQGDGVASPVGSLSVAQIKAMLKYLPVDITFIDGEDINRFYKNTDRVFSRPVSTLDHPTYYCHPPVIRTVVEKLIDDFKNGTRDSFERYIPSAYRPVRILYLAVRDEQGNYMGTMEIVQNLTSIRDALNIGPSRINSQSY